MANTTHTTALLIACCYLVITVLIGVVTRRRAQGADQYMVAGRTLGAGVVGLILMSEFLGLGSTVGTAEFGYEHGIGAAWQLVTIAIAFVLFAFLMAPRYRGHKQDTVSGIIDGNYGHTAKLITSGLMIYAMLAVSCALYVGGTSTLVPLLGLPRPWVLLVIAAITVLYLTLGGMRAVAFTNVLDAVMIVAGTLLAAVVGLSQAGGISGLTSNLKPFMFDPVSMGWPKIVAWLLSNVGAVFATQYIVQALASSTSVRTARRASFVAAGTLLPVGFFAAVVGMSAAVLFPNAVAAQSFGLLASTANPWIAGLIIIGVGSAMLGTIGAITHASTQLITRDFYPLFQRGQPLDDRKQVRFARRCNGLLVLLPVPFVLFTPGILSLVFFARDLRATIAVLVIFVFFLPRLKNRAAAITGLVLSVVGSSVWYLLGDPWGIDGTYVAICAPLATLLLAQLLSTTHRRKPTDTHDAAKLGTPQPESNPS